MTTRADFLTSATALAVAATAVPSLPSGLRKPPMLRAGDTVGLIAPASPLSDTEIATGVSQVESLGLRVRLGRYAHATYGYLAGTDAQRADDFNAMARDPQIRGIFALRGGYGTMRILDALDYDALRRQPKVILGFSDMTAILNAVTTRSGIVTFHGPVASLSTFTPIETAAVKAALMSPNPIGKLHNDGTIKLTGGKARGRLAGGNLSLVAALCGTAYAIPAAGSLLFLEETHEEPYRVDRMLTTLALAGYLHSARGIIWGACSHCVATDASLTLDQIYAGTIGRAGRPAITGAKIGHISNQWVLPIGAMAELDADAGTLTILESGVTA